jgi:hypothetical protein
MSTECARRVICHHYNVATLKSARLIGVPCSASGQWSLGSLHSRTGPINFTYQLLAGPQHQVGEHVVAASQQGPPRPRARAGLSARPTWFCTSFSKQRDTAWGSSITASWCRHHASYREGAHVLCNRRHGDRAVVLPCSRQGPGEPLCTVMGKCRSVPATSGSQRARTQVQSTVASPVQHDLVATKPLRSFGVVTRTNHRRCRGLSPAPRWSTGC